VGKLRRKKVGSRQVLILYQASLLAQGVESLLRKERGLDVVGLRLGSGPGGGHGEGLDPDVIILDTCDLGGRAGMTVLGLLQAHPRAKVICLNAEDDKLEVYRRHERVAARREELVEAIRSN